jgi:iron complex outermembrane receptor protein
MKSGLFRSFFLAVALTLASSFPVFAQQSGSIEGVVRETGTGRAVSGATVQAVGGGGVAATATSDVSGRFTLSGLPAGSYSVVINRAGSDERRVEGVTVQAGQVARITAELQVGSIELDPVVISASRRPEKALSAPAHVETVPARVIEERPAITPTDFVRTLPGVDVANTGLMTSNVVTRGFNNIFSGALLMITDNRYASVPSLRVNAPYMIPSNNDDIDHIEVLLGPASALYGPNTANGVMHIITKSPFDSQGTTLSLAGGERSVFQAEARNATVINDHVAFKVSGQYFRGNDWKFTDPFEEQARDAAIAAGDADTRIGRRDESIENFKGDARIDIRPGGNSEAVLAFGASQVGSGIELTGLGAAQVKDWRYSYAQARFSKDRLFAQVFGNFSNAGDTYLLRTGEPIVDKSRIYVAQLQHGFSLLNDRQQFTYGVDFQRTEPRTEGTILGRNEGVKVNEIGAYLQSESQLTKSLSLIAAARLDDNDYVDETVFSPRAALVFQPTSTQTFRVSYNRAFETPTSNNLFLDIVAARLPGDLYSVRALGVPKSGFTFRRDCGGLCMRSPFGTGSQFVPLDATMFWPAVVAAVQAQTGKDISGIPAPTAADVKTVLRVLNTTDGSFSDVNAADVRDIRPIEPTITNSFEAGWRGLVGDRLMVSLDVYHTRKDDFVGPLIVETPNAFLDTQSLTAYLSKFLPAAQAAQLAAGIGGLSGNPDVTGIPLGTVVPDNPLTENADMMVTYRNFGEVSLWGSDVGAQFLVNDRLSFQGSYSYVSKDYWTAQEVGGLSPIALNAPPSKASLAANYDNPSGFVGELRGRYVDSFAMNSGVYIGDIDSYGLVDASVGYHIPMTRGSALLTLSAQNLFDDRTQQFVGAPAMGRLIMTRIRYTF